MKRTLLFLLFSVMPTWLFANEAVGNAVAVIGSVTIVRADTGEENPLQRNGEIFLNDTIKTGADGLVKVLLKDESILKVSPATELQISEMIAGPGEGGRSTVELLKGRIRSVIGNKLGANSEFNVNTPVAVAGVRGTDFEVVHTLVDGEWVTGVRCFDGAVALSTVDLLSSISNTLILPNQYSLARTSALPSTPQNMPEGQSLFDVLGVEDPAGGINENGEPIDIELDIEQVQSVLLNLNANLDLNIDTILDAIPTQPGTATRREEEQVDTQLETITSPLSNEAELNFDIEIPLPN
jgi:hypothetical protein